LGEGKLNNVENSKGGDQYYWGVRAKTGGPKQLFHFLKPKEEDFQSSGRHGKQYNHSNVKVNRGKGGNNHRRNKVGTKKNTAREGKPYTLES